MSTAERVPAAHDSPRPADPLAPVRDAVLADARRDADADVAAAQRAGDALVAAAAAQAETIRADARAEGERDAEAVRVAQRARARRRARAIVLGAQQAALDDLHREVRSRLRAAWEQESLRADLVARLSATARADLGPDVAVHEHPDGGIVATVDGARAIYRLADLADQVTAGLPDALVAMWTP